MKRLLLIALLVMAVAHAGSRPKNLIKNSSFEALNEDGIPVGWNAAGHDEGISIDAASARHGKIGLHFALDGKMTTLSRREYFKLQPGRRYTFSAYVRTRNLEPADGLQVQIINLGWSFSYQSRLPIKEATADWRRYSRTFVCPPASAFRYRGADNVLYKPVVYAKGARGQVSLDALQLEEGAAATEYEPREGASTRSADPIFDAIAEHLKRKSFKRAKFFHVKNPMFEELLGDEPGPQCVLYYGYQDLWVDSLDRPYAKKFGHRHVLHEQIEELRSRPFVPMTNGWSRGGVGSYSTMRMILRPDVQGIAPKVFGKNPWIMDPKWQEAYIKAAAKLAEQSMDHRPGNAWGNTWGLWAGDEVFECSGIKVVPTDKRYEAVHAIDKEVRQKFGFGKYGIPKSEEDANPFARIAFRRWVNARLTETYKKTHALVKKINPKLVLLGPDPCGGVPPVDLEAMTPYFDLVSNQSWYSPNSFTQQLATGADTKAMVDLSACPVWALVQHFAAKDTEALREQFSQVFRNGGAGLVVLGVEWYDRELEHPKYINPAKWRALLEITDTVTRMNKVRLPRPDTAVLYASDTFLTFNSPKMADPKRPQMYAAYAALGPCIGSWFSFVSDRQIDRGVKKLSDYRALYIPLATYQRRAVLDKVERYVRDGGLVVCSDPTAFTWDINGEDLSSKWESISGIKKGKPRSGTPAARTVNSGIVAIEEIELRFPGPGVKLSPLDASVKPLATFADGSLAAAIGAYGKGYVITFASDPFASVDRHTPLIRMFKSIQLSVGARTDLDIWRFKLPAFKTVHLEETGEHLCLTNNNMVLGIDGIRPGRNLDTRGTYTYSHSRFPTGIPDAATSGQITFAEGHLTNRKEAYADRKRGGARNPASPEKWIVSWTDKKPVALTMDFKKAYGLDRTKIFYSGSFPAVTARGSRDGETWQPIGSYPAQCATADVIDVSVLLKGNHRYVEVAFSRRGADVPFEFVEIEVWGTE